jgi:hypothetical protein
VTRRTARRDLALIIGATIVIVVIAWLARQPRAETCQTQTCAVVDWRDYERVDGV